LKTGNGDQGIESRNREGVKTKSTREIGLKITAAQREYHRYTGVSAEIEKRGAGSSRPELAWPARQKTEQQTADEPDRSSTKN